MHITVLRVLVEAFHISTGGILNGDLFCEFFHRVLIRAPYSQHDVASRRNIEMQPRSVQDDSKSCNLS